MICVNCPYFHTRARKGLSWAFAQSIPNSSHAAYLDARSEVAILAKHNISFHVIHPYLASLLRQDVTSWARCYRLSQALFKRSAKFHYKNISRAACLHSLLFPAIGIIISLLLLRVIKKKEQKSFEAQMKVWGEPSSVHTYAPLEIKYLE